MVVDSETVLTQLEIPLGLMTELSHAVEVRLLINAAPALPLPTGRRVQSPLMQLILIQSILPMGSRFSAWNWSSARPRAQ